MIRLRSVTKTYGGNVILNNVSLDLSDGVICGLVGANGCGKTTLMRCICGFTHPDSGTVEVNGEIIGKNRDFPDKTGIILETPSFLPQYSGIKNLQLLAGISGYKELPEIKRIMRFVGLDPDDKKEVKKYSLGMRQRLGIAQAIMENPQILILDEPFNGLDQDGIEDIHVLLKKLKANGKLIFLASHSATDIERSCDFVYEMRNGELHLRNKCS